LKKLLWKHQQVKDQIVRRKALRSYLPQHLHGMQLSTVCDIAGVSDIDPFDFSQFVDEDAGTPSFC